MCFIAWLRLRIFYFQGGFTVKSEEKNNEEEMYRKMYFTLARGVCDAIDICQDAVVKRLLIKAHRDAEEIYISAE